MKLTLRKALQICREWWDWLAEHPDQKWNTCSDPKKVSRYARQIVEACDIALAAMEGE